MSKSLLEPMPKIRKLCRDFNPSLAPYWYKAVILLGGPDMQTLVDWCEENCQGRFTYESKNWLTHTTRTFWFKRQNDCTQFKLVWGHE